MSIQLTWKPSRTAADIRTPAMPAEQQKAALLDGMKRGEHLVTLLGQACRTIAELTGDSAFYEQSRLAVRGLGTAVNHKPTEQQEYDGLLEQIARLTAAQRYEDDPVFCDMLNKMACGRSEYAARIGARIDESCPDASAAVKSK